MKFTKKRIGIKAIEIEQNKKRALLLIGLKLRKMRLERGYKSYETFAFEYEINRMQYWKMEKGMANMTISSLMNILEIYKMSFKDFFADIDQYDNVLD